MDRSLSFICFLILMNIGFAQSEITVVDSSDNSKLENVEAYSESGYQFGTSNANGIIQVPKGVKEVLLRLEGYQDKIIKPNKSKLTVSMTSFSILLDETVVNAGDPIAKALIRKVIQNQKKNNPENLDNFQYKTYSKFSAQVANKDSIPIIAFPKNESDSSHNDFRKVIDKSLLFIGERGMDHKYDKKFGRKNIVRASRVSGLKTPLYEFVAAQPISHNFDNEKFSFFFTSYTNPVSKSGLETYHYRITDTIQLKNTNAIVVAFKPKSKSKKKNKIQGKIFIEDKSYAVIKFNSEGTGKSIAELEMDWTKYKDYWFPKEQRFLLEAGDWDYPVEYDSVAPDGTIVIDTIKKKQPIWANLVNTFKDFQSPVNFERKEFKGYENEVAVDAFDNWDENLKLYRNESLTEIERNTYPTIDSIGQEEKVDKALKLLRIVTRGGLYEAGKFDIDLTKVIGFNDYEGFRLGIPLATNYKFNENFSLNGYVAYGFKDERFKYGVGFDWFVNKPYSGKFFANYKNDVAPSGRTELLLQSNFTKFRDESLENIFNRQFYTFQNVNVGYQQDLLKNVTANFSLNYEEQRSRFGYSYKGNPIDSELKTTYASLAVRWSPKSRFMRTPYGKVTIASGYPYFYFTLNQGINVFNSDYNPFKFDTRIYHRIRTFAGRTNIQFNGGFIIGDSPLTNLFEGYGNGRDGTSIGGRFGIASGNAFETMQPGEFYSDRYASIQLKHQIAGFKLLKKEIYPTFIYRSLIGDLDNPENHQNFAFNTPTDLYQEVGVEFDRIFLGFIGVGTYYRFGAYSLGDFEQNFSWKLTLNLPSF